MTEKKIVVPEGMLKSAIEASLQRDPITGIPVLSRGFNATIISAIEAALLWIAEHPIVPNHTQTIYLCKSYEGAGSDYCQSIRDVACSWQEIMFFAPEPEVPKEMKDLLVNPVVGMVNGMHINDRILEAFRRGQNSK